MKKTYMLPKMKVMKLHPRTTMLTGSPLWPEEDTAGFNNEPEGPEHFY